MPLLNPKETFQISKSGENYRSRNEKKQIESSPDGATSFYEYLSGGAMTFNADADGVTTLYSHQGGELLTKSIALGAENLVTAYGYDSRGRQIKTTSPGQRTTLTTLDERGDVLRRTDPLGHRSGPSFSIQ